MLRGEDAEQIALFDWIKLRPDIEPYAFHIPNERICSVHAGYILKRKGVKSGVSDNFIAIPSKGFHGLFIELKYKKNKPTENQVKFLENMSLQGYATEVCYSFEEARNVILIYLDKKL